MCAVEWWKLDAVKYLVEYGVNIDETDNKGKTALRYAAVSGNLDIVKYLVDNGADVNAKDNDGRTAYSSIASTDGYSDIVEYLNARGAKW